MEDLLPAVIVFGLMLAISLFGLFRSNASSERLNASTDGSNFRTTYRPLETGGQ